MINFSYENSYGWLKNKLTQVNGIFFISFLIYLTHFNFLSTQLKNQYNF